MTHAQSHVDDTAGCDVLLRRHLERRGPPRDIRRIFCLSGKRDEPCSSGSYPQHMSAGHSTPVLSREPKLAHSCSGPRLVPCVHSVPRHAQRYSALRYLTPGMLSSGRSLCAHGLPHAPRALCTQTHWPGLRFLEARVCDRASSTRCAMLRPRGAGSVRF